MQIFTAQQMRELDRLTVERCGIPYATLMETAGARVVEAIIREYGPVAGKGFQVFCGKGNNGGDGAVIARLLWLMGAKVAVVLLGKVEDTKDEARVNFDILKEISAGEFKWDSDPLRHVFEDEKTLWPVSQQRLSFKTLTNSFVIGKEDIVIIDAIFGTGLGRAVEGPYAQVIEAINEHRAQALAQGKRLKVVAVDLPSGLSSDHDQPIGPHIQADLTVSFTGLKIGNLNAANGKLIIARIGTPAWLLADVHSALTLVEEKQISNWLHSSRRLAHAHKGAVGDVLIIAGSRGKTGAAALAAETVLRSGAGLVTIATARSAQALLVTQTINEVMTEPLDELASGAIAHTALARALELADKRTVLALGPGLSSSAESTRQFVRQFVEQRQAPLLIDADGLNALAPWPEELQGSAELPIIITPHPGEMARLTGKTNAEIVADRINIAREFATKQQVITVLKGSRTLVAAPDGEVYVNPTGNAGMATAGSGDVLTGLIAGLLAQRPADALYAVIAGVYLHGLAGDLAAEQLGQRSLIASDIIAHLSAAILRTGGAAERGQNNTITFI